jgi:RNA polymerase sigma-70 factor, ECF subfamily
VSTVPNDAADLPSGGGVRQAVPDPAAEERFRKIHDQFAEPILRYLIRLTKGDRERSRDLLQETFLRAWHNINFLSEHEHKVRSWLYTVAHNVLIDAIRARESRPSEVTTLDMSRIGGVTDETDRIVDAHALRTAMQRLSPAHRAVLVEMYFYGSSVAQAAARLGVPEGTVKSRSHHAVRALHAALKSVGLA